MARNVLDAATDLSPRIVIDPRAGYHYVVRLASTLVNLQGGLVLRTIVTTPTDARDPSDQRNVRFIA